MEDAAVARSLGERGVLASGEGVRPSVEGGRRRRARREWRGGRMSNSCGGGRVSEVGGVVAVGMMGSFKGCGGYRGKLQPREMCTYRFFKCGEYGWSFGKKR